MISAGGAPKSSPKPPIKAPKEPFDPQKARSDIFFKAALARGLAIRAQEVRKPPFSLEQPHVFYARTYDVVEDKDGVPSKGTAVSSQFYRIGKSLDVLAAQPETQAFAVDYKPIMAQISGLMKERAIAFLEGNQKKVEEHDVQLNQLFDKAKLVKENAEKDVKVKEAIAKDEELRKLDNLKTDIQNAQYTELKRFAETQRARNFQRIYAPRAPESYQWIRAEGEPEDQKKEGLEIELSHGESAKTILPGWYTRQATKDFAISVKKDKEGRLWARPVPPPRSHSKSDYKEKYRAVIQLLNPAGTGEPISMQADPNMVAKLRDHKFSDSHVMVRNWIHWTLELAKEQGKPKPANPGVELQGTEVYMDFLEQTLHQPTLFTVGRERKIAALTALKEAITKHNEDVQRYQYEAKEEAKKATAQTVGKEEAGRDYIKELEKKGRAGDAKDAKEKAKGDYINSGLDEEVKDIKRAIADKKAGIDQLKQRIENAKEISGDKGLAVVEADMKKLQEEVQKLQDEYKQHRQVLSAAKIKHDGMAGLDADFVQIGPEKIKELQSNLEERRKIMEGIAKFNKQVAEAVAADPTVKPLQVLRQEVDNAHDEMRKDAALNKLLKNIENMSSDKQESILKKEAEAVANRLKSDFNRPEKVIQRKIWNELIAEMRSKAELDKDKLAVLHLDGLKNALQELDPEHPRGIQARLEGMIDAKENQLKPPGKGPAPAP